MGAKTFVGMAGTAFACFVVACSSGEPFQSAAEDAGADGDKGRTTCNIDAPIEHGVRADGRVDVSAQEAWPNRAPEPPMVTPSELLRACAILSACFRIPTPDGGALDIDKQMAHGLRSCLDRASHGNEERVIPDLSQNERWSFTLRTLLSKPGCGGLFISAPRPPPLISQDDARCRT